MNREDETLLWQGRPDSRLEISVRSPLEFGFGMTFLGGPLTPLLLLYFAGSPHWPYFLLPMAGGLWLLVGWCVMDAARRRVTRYYLSDRRMVIDTLWPGLPRRREIALTPETPIRLDAPHVWFAQEDRGTWDGRPPPLIGFEHLDDARSVAEQMQRAQWALSLPPEAIRDR